MTRRSVSRIDDRRVSSRRSLKAFLTEVGVDVQCGYSSLRWTRIHQVEQTEQVARDVRIVPSGVVRHRFRVLISWVVRLITKIETDQQTPDSS